MTMLKESEGKLRAAKEEVKRLRDSAKIKYSILLNKCTDVLGFNRIYRDEPFF